MGLANMYCPNCGQQQHSGEMRFCSRCGLALTGLQEWLASGGIPTQTQPTQQIQTSELSPRRKGIRRGGKVMFFSGVLFVIFLAISIALEEGGPLILPAMVFFVGLMMMLYARLFSDDNPSTPSFNFQAPSTFAPPPALSALPPATNVNIPPIGRQQVRTNELAQPASVTENTTKLLDNE